MKRYTFSLETDKEGEFYTITDNLNHRVLVTTTSYGVADLIVKCLNYYDKSQNDDKGTKTQD